MSVDLSGEITAIATAVLAALAVATAIFAFLAFRAQSREVRAIERQVSDQQQANDRQAKILELQASELRESLSERKREAEQRRRDQATQVFISQLHGSYSELETADAKGQFVTENWPDPIQVRVTVVNASHQPIYDAALRWHSGSAGHGDPNPEPLGIIMPGEESKRKREFPPDTDMTVSGAVLRFRDAAGITWIRRPDGSPEEQQ
jgi:hypothetical protein